MNTHAVPNVCWTKLTSHDGQDWWVWHNTGRALLAGFDGIGSLLLPEGGEWRIRLAPPPGHLESLSRS